MAEQEPLVGTCQLEYLMVSLLNLELTHIFPSGGIDVLCAHVKELWQPFSPHEVLECAIILFLDLDDGVSASDVLDMEGTQTVDVVLLGSAGFQLEVNQLYCRVDHAVAGLAFYQVLLVGSRILKLLRVACYEFG